MSQLYFSATNQEAKKLSRLCNQGRLRRLHRGIYTDNLNDSVEQIIYRHWHQMVAHIVPQSILSFRTAIDLKPTPYKNQYIVFVTSCYAKTVILPGLIIKIIKGNPSVYCEPVFPNLNRSNVARCLLENLISVKKTDYKNIKTIGIEGVENYLAKELRYRNESALNQIRDEAKKIANDLDFEAEFKKLNTIVSALLSTHQGDNVLKTRYAKAVAKNEPFDAKRLALFEALYLYLKKCNFLERKFIFDASSLRHLSFYESYFSNFIEGTEFTLDEAEDIVFSGKKVDHRHADSHDVMANFLLTNDSLEMTKTPENPAEFLTLLKDRHAYLLKERPEKSPGEFKDKQNKAGNTFFVEPEEVIGTLCQAFPFYLLLNEGLPRALFMQFLVSEVHPFNDGNGRLSRIMMNAELCKVDLFKIIIPTVYRDNYLNGLRLASRDKYFYTYCKMLDQAQAYTASIPWGDYNETRQKIELDHADKTSDEGLPIFNRKLRILVLSHFPIVT